MTEQEKRFTGLYDDQGNPIREGDVVLWRAGFGVQGTWDPYYMAVTVRFWEKKGGSHYESRWLLGAIHNYWGDREVRLAPADIDPGYIDNLAVALDIDGKKIERFTEEDKIAHLQAMAKAGSEWFWKGLEKQ